MLLIHASLLLKIDQLLTVQAGYFWPVPISAGHNLISNQNVTNSAQNLHQHPSIFQYYKTNRSKLDPELGEVF